MRFLSPVIIVIKTNSATTQFQFDRKFMKISRFYLQLVPLYDTYYYRYEIVLIVIIDDFTDI